jgi:hypothetical protein
VKAYGYGRNDEESESPTELREVALSVKVDEIDTLMNFFRDAKERFCSGRPVSGQAHAHLRDFLSKWNPEDADVILVFEE